MGIILSKYNICHCKASSLPLPPKHVIYLFKSLCLYPTSWGFAASDFVYVSHGFVAFVCKAGLLALLALLVN